MMYSSIYFLFFSFAYFGKEMQLMILLVFLVPETSILIYFAMISPISTGIRGMVKFISETFIQALLIFWKAVKVIVQ